MNLAKVIALIILLECAFSLVFWLIMPRSLNNKKFDIKSVFKGLVERFFLTYSLYHGFPHALTLFGALKLGTRLKREEKNNSKEEQKTNASYNDYYLIGNFISVGLSIFYYTLLHNL